ncbi:hypothetical protein ASF78_07890 [Cellulomonas sp. Leaf334]|nr:hypothetical protein ASF78_07890 [Cellulomonas sp. Leaf334]
MEDPQWAAVFVAGGALLVSILAALFTGVSLGYTRGQRDATVRQADAAEAQVVVMQRQVDLMEQGAGGASVSQVPYVPPWSVIHSANRNGLRLINGGDETAHEVEVTFNPSPPENNASAMAWDKIEPHASVEFVVMRSFAWVPDTVNVRWRRVPGGEDLYWTTPPPL